MVRIRLGRLPLLELEKRLEVFETGLVLHEIGQTALSQKGLIFVGIDVIAGHLSEINVTSPTGIREVEQLGKIPLADLTQQRLLQD